jgi:hypothetical protein
VSAQLTQIHADLLWIIGVLGALAGGVFAAFILWRLDRRHK